MKYYGTFLMGVGEVDSKKWKTIAEKKQQPWRFNCVFADIYFWKKLYETSV